VDRFLALFHQIVENRLDEGYVSHLEGKDNIFPNIDYKAYVTR
jgi:predicted glycosyl hydrolase (DUF1957 family)